MNTSVMPLSCPVTVCMVNMDKLTVTKKAAVAALSDPTQNEKIVGFSCADSALESYLTQELERAADRFYSNRVPG